MDQLVTTREHTERLYLLLQPGSHPARTGNTYQQFISTSDEISSLIEVLSHSRIVALDFETQGGDYSEEIRIVGLGLSWDTGSCYIPYDTLPDSEELSDLLRMLSIHSGLIAHNVYFDGGVWKRNFLENANWYICTYSLLALLHNESPESKWGLKDAQTNLLGWENTNEAGIDNWLVENGFKNQAGNPIKAEMWRVPHEILGQYCVLDAESTYLLFTEILEPALMRFPELSEFMQKDMMPHIIGHIDQRICGIEVDTQALRNRSEKLSQSFIDYTEKVLSDKKLHPHILEIEKEIRKPVYEKIPAELKKDGTVSKNYLKKMEKIKAVENYELPEYNFNLSSNQQLGKLLYDKLKFPVRITSETGQPATSIKALKHMGDIGSLLIERAYIQKEIGFVEKYVELTANRNTIHPSFRMPGTVTGRLSSKEPNLQQIPKTIDMMQLFVARKGMVWVDLDFSALEPVVATEFSRDPNMMLIYGDGRPSNDIYLFVAASIDSMRSKILAAGYDPVNPTPEGLANAKKICKHERNICKTVTLACQYGAGVRKVMQTLEDDGIQVEYEEVERIHSGYWDTFAKVKDFGRSLFYEWRKNRGYILNGLGRPMAVPEFMTQDLLNRFVQSTGHDILVKYVRILTENLRRNNIPYNPIVLDFHDATTVEVEEALGLEVLNIFVESMAELNAELGGTITLRGTPVIGRSLSDVKEPES